MALLPLPAGDGAAGLPSGPSPRPARHRGRPRRRRPPRPRVHLARVPAGFPSPADDYVEGRLDLHNLVGTHAPSCFFLRVAGESTTGDGILDGDLLVVDRAPKPVSGDIVVAAVDGELTVRRFVRRGRRVALLEANPDSTTAWDERWDSVMGEMDSAASPADAFPEPLQEQPGEATMGNVDPIWSSPLFPIGDAKNWMLTEPLVWRVLNTRDSIVVPKGFVTDFASIPPRLQSLIQPLGPHLNPAIIHDYLYWRGARACTKAQADRLFRLAMREMRVPPVDRDAMYGAVAVGGQAAWESNARERAVGWPRVVPGGARRSRPHESWPQFRRYLYNANVRPERGAIMTPGFCAHGGSP